MQKRFRWERGNRPRRGKAVMFAAFLGALVGSPWPPVPGPRDDGRAMPRRRINRAIPRTFSGLVQYVEDSLRDLDESLGMLHYGRGSPEGVVASKIGGLYLRHDGAANTTLYVKESGGGKTGWVGK